MNKYTFGIKILAENEMQAQQIAMELNKIMNLTTNDELYSIRKLLESIVPDDEGDDSALEKIKAFTSLSSEVEHDDLIGVVQFISERPDLISFVKNNMPQKGESIGITKTMKLIKEFNDQFNS